MTGRVLATGNVTIVLAHDNTTSGTATEKIRDGTAAGMMKRLLCASRPGQAVPHWEPFETGSGESHNQQE